MLKEKSKNLIVIIGNGFDLAHKLETSYNDFANYYLKEIILDKLINYENNNPFLRDRYLHYINVNNTDEKIRVFSDLFTDNNKFHCFNNLLDDISRQNEKEVLRCLKINNDFIQYLIPIIFYK